MMLVVTLVAALFVTTAMLAVGFEVDRDSFRTMPKAKGLWLRSLVTNFVLLPALGVLITRVVPMSRDAAAGIVLVAFSPGGVSALQFTGKTKGALFFAGALAFILSLLSLLISPLAAQLVIGQRLLSSVPYGRTMILSLLFLLLPLLGGMAVRARSPHVAKKLARPTVVVATLAFFAFVLLLMPLRKRAISALGSPVVIAMLAFVVLSMVIGWFMGGPDHETRRVLATASSMRNAALAFVIASRAFPDTGVDATVAAFSALMIPPNMLFALYSGVRARRQRLRASHS
jgi:BASS family bile acid:Na+ symporter